MHLFPKSYQVGLSLNHVRGIILKLLLLHSTLLIGGLRSKNETIPMWYQGVFYSLVVPCAPNLIGRVNSIFQMQLLGVILRNTQSRSWMLSLMLNSD